ncbi:MAG: glycosyltransferase family 4 protein [Porticoccaceae bacterium]|nr:glycosyltransferase family 4 protein [Porticoccaceae bacterium]
MSIFVVSAAASLTVLNIVRRRQLLDIPNARSSHNLPTPKGGGLGFAAIIATVFIASGALSNSASGSAVMVLGITALALAITGLVDDLRPLASSTRMLIQLLAGLVIVFVLPRTSVDLGFMRLSPVAAACLALLFLLWMTNLYNFMDGIDGIASFQAILLGAGIYCLDALALYSGNLAGLALVIATCVGGFLLFNFPPAKIFMGDVGSVFLGFTLAAIALFEGADAIENLWIWLILMAVFICDATATLLARLAQRQKLYQAHRSHIYQLYTQTVAHNLTTTGMTAEQARAQAHRRYLIWFSLCFSLVQFPLAIAVAARWLPGLPVALFTYGLLIVGFISLGAGRDRLALCKGNPS